MKVLQKYKELKIINPNNFLFMMNSDQHNNEYLCNEDKQIEKISGFKGSNAYLISTEEENIVFTDSRYFIQIKRELKSEFKFKPITELKPYLKKFENRNMLCNLSKIPYYVLKNRDINKFEHLNENEEQTKIINDFIFLDKNLSKKLEKIKHLVGENVLVVNKLDDIAWLLGLRCLHQIQNNPIFFSYLIIDFSSKIIEVFADFQHSNVKDFLQQQTDYKFLFSPYNDFNKLKEYKSKIFYSETLSTKKVIDLKKLNSECLTFNPIEEIKAQKTELELTGMKKALKKDGYAFLRLHYWMLKNLNKVNEFDVVLKLKQIRSEINSYVQDSFDTISSESENSAVVHYRASENSKIINNHFLLDAGAHFHFTNELYGTTDTTRTLCLNIPDKLNKEIYTRVLLGNLAVERSVINLNNTTGRDLDVLARQFLNRANYDYGHGTGHGVGAFLNVHEGGISLSGISLKTIKEGMVFSNEPGCYLEDQFGVRIENLLCVEKGKLINMTRYPYESKLIDRNLISNEDIHYINQYHSIVYDDLIKEIDEEKSDNKEELKEFLKQITKEIRI